VLGVTDCNLIANEGDLNTSVHVAISTLPPRNTGQIYLLRRSLFHKASPVESLRRGGGTLSKRLHLLYRYILVAPLAPSWPPSCWARSATSAGSPPSTASRPIPAPPRWRPPAARSSATAGRGLVTAGSTTPCTWWRRCRSAGPAPGRSTTGASWPRARPQGSPAVLHWPSIGRGDPEPWVMAPRSASGDGLVAVPPDGQFQSCRPWRAEALQTGVRDPPRRGPNNEEPATRAPTNCGATQPRQREARCSSAGTGPAPPTT
jgi:hypothetical protein